MELTNPVDSKLKLILNSSRASQISTLQATPHSKITRPNFPSNRFKRRQKSRQRRVLRRPQRTGSHNLSERIFRNSPHSQILLEHLDLNKDGFVNFDEFLVNIRGKCNEI